MAKTLLYSGNVDQSLSPLLDYVKKERVNNIVYLGGQDTSEAIKWLSNLHEEFQGELIAVPSISNLLLRGDLLLSDEANLMLNCGMHPRSIVPVGDSYNTIAIGGGFAGKLPENLKTDEENLKRAAYQVDTNIHVAQNFWHMRRPERSLPYDLMLRGNSQSPQIAYFTQKGKIYKKQLRKIPFSEDPLYADETVLKKVETPNTKIELDSDNMFLISPGRYKEKGQIAVIETNVNGFQGRKKPAEVIFTTL